MVDYGFNWSEAVWKRKKIKGVNPGRKAEKARRSMDIRGKSTAFLPSHSC
jgi:hypothetical protein